MRKIIVRGPQEVYIYDSEKPEILKQLSTTYDPNLVMVPTAYGLWLRSVHGPSTEYTRDNYPLTYRLLESM